MEDINKLINNIDIEKFHNMQLDSIYYSPSIQQKALEQMNNNMQIKNNEDAQYKLEVLNTLVDIKNNTANIGDVVTLIRENNEYQDIIIKTLTEILLLTKEENDMTILNKFNNIMDEAERSIKNVVIIKNLWSICKPILSLLMTVNT